MPMKGRCTGEIYILDSKEGSETDHYRRFGSERKEKRKSGITEGKAGELAVGGTIWGTYSR